MARQVRTRSPSPIHAIAAVTVSVLLVGIRGGSGQPALASPDETDQTTPRVWSLQELVITYGEPESPKVVESVDLSTRQASRAGSFELTTVGGEAQLSLNLNFQLPSRVVEGEVAKVDASASGTVSSSGVGESTEAVLGEFALINARVPLACSPRSSSSGGWATARIPSAKTITRAPSR